MSKKVLVVGALGYIGAHVVDALTKRGHVVTAIDEDVTSPNMQFVYSRVSTLEVRRLSSDSPIHGSYDAIINLAAYISVEESTRTPYRYWSNNMGVLSALLLKSTDHLIFASTGTAFCPDNPYARSKLAGENMVRDCAPEISTPYTIFRFFNVAGLAEGIKPTGKPTHLIRLAAMAASGQIPELKVYGNTYGTRDGTCVRDYIHVVDVAESIANAVDVGAANTEFECLGTGTGHTVLEVVDAMQQVTGKVFPIVIAPPRPGDVAEMICPSQYKHISLSHTLSDMCLSAYRNI